MQLWKTSVTYQRSLDVVADLRHQVEVVEQLVRLVDHQEAHLLRLPLKADTGGRKNFQG